MVDSLTPEARSRLMARVRGKDTKVEIAVRRLIWSMGVRYRLHQQNLPGHPDLVFSSRKKVIFIHGCFWHRHEGCKNNRMPKSNLTTWEKKLERNVARDKENVRDLRLMGWDVLVIWECEVTNKKVVELTNRLAVFLGR